MLITLPSGHTRSRINDLHAYLCAFPSKPPVSANTVVQTRSESGYRFENFQRSVLQPRPRFSSRDSTFFAPSPAGNSFSECKRDQTMEREKEREREESRSHLLSSFLVTEPRLIIKSLQPLNPWSFLVYFFFCLYPCFFLLFVRCTKCAKHDGSW